MPIIRPGRTKTTAHDQRGSQRTARRAGKNTPVNSPMKRENRFTVTDASGRRGRRRRGKSASAPTLMEALMMGGVL